MRNNISFFNKYKILYKRITTREVIFLLMLVFCISPWISPAAALLLGIGIAQFIGHPYLHLNHKATHFLLQTSIVGLGFGMRMDSAMQAGKDGLVLVVLSILGTLGLGYFLGRCFRIRPKIAFLISIGTAICGGSAIAAVSPVIKAKEQEISIALGTIFILNSIALFAFPVVRKYLELSQSQFGLWCAIAIHDTSSVVGAAGRYGDKALEVATTVKLARALWIIPLAFASSIAFRSKDSQIRIPYFIGLFVVAILLHTYVPLVQQIGGTLVKISKSGLTVTLFLIGCGLSKEVLAAVGVGPILQGLLLWAAISSVTLLMLLYL